MHGKISNAGYRKLRCFIVGLTIAGGAEQVYGQMLNDYSFDRSAVPAENLVRGDGGEGVPVTYSSSSRYSEPALPETYALLPEAYALGLNHPSDAPAASGIEGSLGMVEGKPIAAPRSPSDSIIGAPGQTYKAGGATRPPEEPKKKDAQSIKFSGFTQLDMARFGQDSANLATLGDIQDGAGFRRARLAASGSIAKNTSYMFEFDIAQSQPFWVDVWGQFDKTPLGQLRVGRFRQPFGMTEMTGIRDQPFLERPVVFALAPFRQTGLMLSDTYLDETMTLANSVFRTASDNYGNVYGDNGGYGTALRITKIVREGGDHQIVHLGADYAYVDPARNQLQLASQDETFLSQNPNFGPGGLDRSPVSPFQPIQFVPAAVNTGTFSVNNVNLFNVEAAIGTGRTVFLSEVRWGVYDLPGSQSVIVPAFYADIRRMLTHEEIPYNRKAGVFGRPKPDCPLDFEKGEYGAWEINAQVSHLDASNLFGKPGVPGACRSLTTITSGVVWYINAHAKGHLQYSHGFLDDPVIGSSNLNTVASMIQFDF